MQISQRSKTKSRSWVTFILKASRNLKYNKLIVKLMAKHSTVQRAISVNIVPSQEPT